MPSTQGILLYLYPYQLRAWDYGFAMMLILGITFFGLYFLITWKMGPNVKEFFQGFLVISVIACFVLFLTEGVLALITIYQVNKQLGFSFATPDTPEGELFEISKVDPGKTMDEAGLKLYDQVQMGNCNDFYVLLIQNQRGEFCIPIKRNKKKMTIRVLVPILEVPFAKVSFLFP